MAQPRHVRSRTVYAYRLLAATVVTTALRRDAAFDASRTASSALRRDDIENTKNNRLSHAIAVPRTSFVLALRILTTKRRLRVRSEGFPRVSSERSSLPRDFSQISGRFQPPERTRGARGTTVAARTRVREPTSRQGGAMNSYMSRVLGLAMSIGRRGRWGAVVAARARSGHGSSRRRDRRLGPGRDQYDQRAPCCLPGGHG